MSNSRSYSELSKISDLLGRFEYLAIGGTVGEPTFGWERYLNQKFYTSAEWRSVRKQVIIRDNGCDLGVEGYELHGRIYIHHMNPIRPEQLKNFDYSIVDPEYLISVSHSTHNAIHYGDPSQLPQLPIERTPGDHILW